MGLQQKWEVYQRQKEGKVNMAGMNSPPSFSVSIMLIPTPGILAHSIHLASCSFHLPC